MIVTVLNSIPYFSTHPLWLIAAVAVFLAGIFLWKLFAGTQSAINKQLVVGIAPCNQENQFEKALDGFTRDMIAQVGKKMGMSAIFVAVRPDKIEQSVAAQKVDVALLSGTRAATQALTLEYVNCRVDNYTKMALIFWDRMPHHIANIADFLHYSDNTTAVLQGSFEERYLQSFDGIRVKPVESITRLMVNLKVGVVRAALVRFDQAELLRKEYGNIKTIKIALNGECALQEDHLVVLRDNKKIAGKLCQKVASLRRGKLLDKLYAQWFDPAKISVK